MAAISVDEYELQLRINNAARRLAESNSWLTPDEAAARARLSKSHFLRLVRTGKGPAHSGHGRLMRFQAAKIDSWIAGGLQ